MTSAITRCTPTMPDATIEANGAVCPAGWLRVDEPERRRTGKGASHPVAAFGAQAIAGDDPTWNLNIRPMVRA